MKKHTQEQTFRDFSIVAFLKLKGLAIKPKKTPDGVLFDVTGDIEKTLQCLYQNEAVGALDLIEAIKSIRSIIFSLK